MRSLSARPLRSVLLLAALAAASACSESGSGISGVEPVGAAAAGKAKPTEITASASSYLCGTLYGSGFTIDPYCTGGPFGGFQSTAGTGYQNSIYISFSSPVSSVTLTALDPDYYGNYITAYDAYGNPVDYEEFAYDNTPGTFTSSTRTVSGSGITLIALTPNSLDYIAYDDLYYY